MVQPKMKLSVRSPAQNGQQHEKWSEAAQEIGIYLGPYSSKKWEKNISAVLSSWRLLMCNACADGPRFTVQLLIISLSEKYHNCLPRGPARSISMRGALCCFLSRCTRFLENIQKQETVRLKTVQFLAEKERRPQTLKCSWRKLTKTTSSRGA